MNSYQCINTRQQGYRRERGAILVTALVMLIILTLLGLASMRNSAMEERMAANDVFRNRAFQAADATVETALVGMVDGSGAINGSSFNQAYKKYLAPLTVTVIPDFTYYTAAGGPAINNTTTLTYMRTVVTNAGGSIGLGQGFTYFLFEVEAQAQVDGTGARSTVTRGVVIPVPNG
ncbi:hypothetical protein MNBD_GAMMA26-79 [hydrothermal vent metagenome]|uniref:Type 4 fimbrial biogenesis protein PilX N-terminal domain-containing protein n=1 Tax=hydrothermal vent metagenome TaxID=652676 RepID=A0A3B1B769_9ZZZZ